MADLHVLPGATLHDIPAMLRKAADRFEAEPDGNISAVVLVSEGRDGSLDVFGLGEADSYRATALLEYGLAWLARKRLEKMP